MGAQQPQCWAFPNCAGIRPAQQQTGRAEVQRGQPNELPPKPGKSSSLACLPWDCLLAHPGLGSGCCEQHPRLNLGDCIANQPFQEPVHGRNGLCGSTALRGACIAMRASCHRLTTARHWELVRGRGHAVIGAMATGTPNVHGKSASLS